MRAESGCVAGTLLASFIVNSAACNRVTRSTVGEATAKRASDFRAVRRAIRSIAFSLEAALPILLTLKGAAHQGSLAQILGCTLRGHQAHSTRVLDGVTGDCDGTSYR